jgi:hypothetical protein
MRRRTAIPFQPQVVSSCSCHRTSILDEFGPVLIVTATKDPGHTGPSDAPWYRPAAAAEGWIVLATDATVRPRNDSVSWRLALLAAGLDVVHHDWPKSAQWPVAFAGISGRAKCAQWLGAILAQTQSLNIRGFFLSGINEDQMPEALKPTTRLLDFCVCQFGPAAELTIVSQPHCRRSRSKVHWLAQVFRTSA